MAVLDTAIHDVPPSNVARHHTVDTRVKPAYDGLML